MLGKVKNADVVVTNPTHYAVAIAYGRGQDAPRVLAKGVDLLALRIRELGREHDVAIVENPPLARQLYATSRWASKSRPRCFAPSPRCSPTSGAPSGAATEVTA